MTTRFVLASASPARRRTLVQAGIIPEVIVSGVNEAAVTASSPAKLSQLLADAKAHAVASEIHGPALVLGCDSVLEFDGESMGKPESTDTAITRWRRMHGKQGVLHTGHALIDVATGRRESATVSTTVDFADITDDEIHAYCHSGEPTTVAGGFTIDGLGGWFVSGLQGDPHNVVGLSLSTLRRMLQVLGYSLADIGWPAR